MLRVSRPGEVAVVYAANLRNEVIVVDDADSVVVVPWPPEYDGYALVCCIKSIPDEVQMAITDEGEVVG